jgi:hypothetical protein
MSGAYTLDDPRAKLAANAAAGAKPAASGFGPSSYAKFYEQQPQETGPGVKTWLARGQNFIIAYSDAEPGAVLERKGQVDEYVLLLQERGHGAVIEANGETQTVDGFSIVMIPPGDSKITLTNGGKVTRLLTTRSKDLADKCSNAATYATPHPNIPPLVNWPDPPAGFKIRAYSLDVPEEPGRFGQIWRCTTFMVNVFLPAGPRAMDKLSPHHHDDFEQCSLCIGGAYDHYLRWPWTSNKADWRPDELEYCGNPSVAVIPARVVHTSASVDPVNPNLLVDIFSPPRVDFSKMPGWVLNADEYPAPEGV